MAEKRKGLKHLKKILLACGIILVFLLIAFFNSDFYFLLKRPTPQSNSDQANLTQITPLSKKESNSLLNRVQNQYGNIKFISHEPSMFFDEKTGKQKIEDIIITSVPVPDSLLGITGLDEKSTYQERINAADALGSNLSKSEQLALLHFLHKRTSEDRLEPMKLNAVKNQVAIALMRQVPVNSEFPLHLIAMYYDKGNIDLTFRDYSIQFLGQCYDQVSSFEYRQLVRETLFKALEENQNIAGSAIISIEGLSKKSGFIRKDIAEAAYKLASDPKTANNVKVPALQIAAKYQHPEAVKLARKFLAKSKQANTTRKSSARTPVMLKMSAIATIGAHGEDTDIALLQKFRKSSDIRLRAAAKAAIKKLMKS